MRAACIIIVIAVVIIITGIGTGMIFNTITLTRNIKKDMVVVSNMADRYIGAEIILLKTKAIALAERFSGVPDEALGRLLQQQDLKAAEFIALTVLDEKGFRADAGMAILPTLQNDQGYVRRAFAGEAVISTSAPVMVPRDTHALEPRTAGLVFYVCVPAGNSPGGEKRVLAAAIPGLFFCDLLAGLPIWESGYIAINDGEGNILANPRPNWVMERRNLIENAKTDSRYREIAAVITNMIQGKSGVEAYSLNGTERLCAYRPLSESESGWSIGVIAPWNESAVQSSQSGFLMVGTVCLLLCVVAALRASRSIELPYATINRMLEKVKAQDALLRTINDVAGRLMEAPVDEFQENLFYCMGMMAACIRADRMRIWKNQVKDNGLTCFCLYTWRPPADAGAPEGGVEHTADPEPPRFCYGETLPSWEEALAGGMCINGISAGFPAAEQEYLRSQGIVSVLAVPLFFHETFWGFVEFNDCHRERTFSVDEENLLRSGGLMVVSAVLRNDMIRDLIQAHEEALANTEAKSNFLANMSHEMRTPLNAIIGLSELTLGSERIQNGDYENLSKIYNSGVTLLGIINDILDLSKIESGKFEIIPVDYDVPSLINDTISLNSIYIGSKPIEFILDIDETLPLRLRGDDLRIKQMFSNLLSNAFKYTKQGRVAWHIYWEREGPWVWLTSSIQDTGVGIRPGDLEKLFSDYNQVDTKSNRKIRGTGLGLAITKRMAEIMHGAVSAESEYGAGSVFTVRIRQEFVSGEPIGHEVVERLRQFRYSEHKRDRNVKLIRAHIPYARVLVVDDIVTNLDVARGLLKHYGMQVDCVSAGAEAVELIRSQRVRYNAIFMDHMMPIMDGVETVRIIRKEIGTDYAKKIPIIALTANALVGNDEMFVNKGFQAFLSKPIDIISLDAIVNRWVRDKKKERELAAQSGAEAELTGEGPAPPDTGGQGETMRIPKEGLPQGDIPGFSIASGLAYFEGMEESYWKILRSYVRNTPPLLEKLRPDTPEALADYGMIIHGIKSSSRTIGAELLGKLAEELEYAAKAGNRGLVAELHSRFMDEAQKLLQGLSAMIKDAQGEEVKPRRPEPDPALLQELREACEAFDVDAVDRIMAELEGYAYASQADLVIWLRDQVNIIGFKQIAERLGQR
jgi:signal transduction histidine kinase/FixJ family two-component response regulator/HPt (histidine-containing phosphotransfer) domain-containing protein